MPAVRPLFRIATALVLVKPSENRSTATFFARALRRSSRAVVADEKHEEGEEQVQLFKAAVGPTSLRACLERRETFPTATEGLMRWMETFLLKDCARTENGNTTRGNAILWENIKKRQGQLETISLSEAPLSGLRPNVGPEGSGTRWEEPKETWKARVGSLVEAIADKSYVPQPLIAANFWEDEQHVADGNHRREAILRRGYEKYWCISLTIDKVNVPPRRKQLQVS